MTTAEAAGTPAPQRQIETEILCPLCSYDLRGLAEPRCPECGYRFEWENLLDPTKRLHRYLFEHHPERNIGSFFRTMLGGLLPHRFWRSLQPAQPSRPRRLVLYWAAAALLGFVAVLTEAGRMFYNHARVQEEMRPSMLTWATRVATAGLGNDPIQHAGGPQAYVDAELPPWHSRRFIMSWLREYRFGRSLFPPLLYLAWPWLTVATLMVFQASMRRAKVRPVHVLRCVLYCCDAGVWLMPLTAFAAKEVSTEIGATRLGPLVSENYYGLPLLVPLLPAVYTAYRLRAAYRHYLRFDHALATATASQFIVLLLVLAGMVVAY